MPNRLLRLADLIEREIGSSRNLVVALALNAVATFSRASICVNDFGQNNRRRNVGHGYQSCRQLADKRDRQCFNLRIAGVMKL
jgi:hypothetical protein